MSEVWKITGRKAEAISREISLCVRSYYFLRAAKNKSVHRPERFTEQLCVYSHHYCAQAHKDGAHSGTEREVGIKNTCCQRNSYYIIACRPDKVLDHFTIRSFAEIYHLNHIFGIVSY